MKINENTCLFGNKTILVPYEKHHVPKYHVWMQSKELQELTASEPLTLEQEYDMQRSWREDDDKCTFIILSKRIYEETQDEIAAMIGDTNLFMNQEDLKKAEVEIMIAEKNARGKGCGLEATLMMMLYGVEILKLDKYEAKISENNEISIKMFKNLSFEEVERSHVFKEVTLVKNVTEKDVNYFKSYTNSEIQDYNTLKRNIKGV